LTGHADALTDRWMHDELDDWSGSWVTLLPGRTLSRTASTAAWEHLAATVDALADVARIDPPATLLARLEPPILARYVPREHAVLIDIANLAAGGDGCSWPRLLGVLAHEMVHAGAPLTWEPHGPAYATAATLLGLRLGIEGCTASDRLDARWSAACWPFAGWHDEALARIPWPHLTVVAR
jgi:hypothetical protein